MGLRPDRNPGRSHKVVAQPVLLAESIQFSAGEILLVILALIIGGALAIQVGLYFKGRKCLND